MFLVKLADCLRNKKGGFRLGCAESPFIQQGKVRSVSYVIIHTVPWKMKSHSWTT